MSRFDEDNNYSEVAQKDFERRIYEECDREDAEDDRGERSCAGQAIQGICKDCGHGSLNSLLEPAFRWRDSGEEDNALECVNCGSTHLDIL